jgi:hypothetical protein
MSIFTSERGFGIYKKSPNQFPFQRKKHQVSKKMVMTKEEDEKTEKI